MLCQFLVYSKENQPSVYIYPLLFGFPSHLGHHRALSRVPCTIQQALISYVLHIVSIMYICQSPSPNSSHHPPHLVSIPLFSRVHSQCHTLYGFGQMYSDICLPLQYHTECSHCPKNPVGSTYSSLPPQPLTTTDLFTVSIVLPFPECHMVGVIQYVSFSDQLLSLSCMHRSFLYIFSWLEGSVLFS